MGSDDMIEHWATACELTESGTAFVEVTMISSRGHVPQEPGAKAIVTSDGLVDGTVGGGKVEAKAIEFARDLLSNGRKDPQLLTWNLTLDIGMTCGGEATFLFEVSARSMASRSATGGAPVLSSLGMMPGKK